MKKGRIVLSNIREHNTELVTINIARKEIKGIVQLYSLAPSWYLVSEFKNNNIDWETYTKYYKHELNVRPQVPKVLNAIKYFLNRGIDIQLICFCKSSKHCHRSLVGEIFREWGYEVIE